MTNSYDPNLEGVSGTVPFSEIPKIATWQQMKYGMFVHWGLYSEIGGVWNGEPVTKGYSEQIQMWANISESDYMEVASHFTADKFDADEICRLAKDAGMQYVLMTTKHHDGFCMFDTETTDYNIVKRTPYGKDPLKELSEACARHGLKFGIYFSLVDWHQGHAFDENNNNPIPENIETIIEKQLTELLTNYGPVCEVWFDMSSPTVAQSEKFKKIVLALQPDAVINSRIWNNMGEFRTLSDNETPEVPLDGAWQTPASIYQETWGYREWQVRTDMSEKVKELIKGLMGGGNYLLNIGPRGDGSIVPFEAEVLQEIGAWLERHPTLIDTTATMFDQHDWGKVRYTDNAIYLMVEQMPENRQLTLKGLMNQVNIVTEDGTSTSLEWTKDNHELKITLPTSFDEKIIPVIKVQINGALETMPQKTMTIEGEQTKISTNNLYATYGYHEHGNYNSMQQVKVRETAYVLSEKAEEISIQLQGEADLEKTYKISFGNQEQEVTGNQLITNQICSFQLKSHDVTPLSITLAAPSHGGEPLALALTSITIIKK